MSTARVVAGRPAPRRGPDRNPARAATSKGASGAVFRAVAACLGAVARRPIPVLIALAVTTLVASVGWNALMLQTAKHPAPLFGRSAPDAVRRPEAVAPLPVPRPSQANAPAATEPPRTAAADPIGALIRTGEAPRAPEAARIAAAQTALTKLGYGPLKSDGVMGIGTKQAIERFERERNLPVTGVLAGKTVKALSQQTGIALD